MISFVFLSALVFADIAFAQACGLNADTPKNSANICNVRGSITPPKGALYRTFYAASYQDCVGRQQVDFDANTSQYNLANGTCSFYYAPLSDMKYIQDNSSNFIYASYMCYNRVYGCPLVNGDFEDPAVAGGNVVLFPTGYKAPAEQIDFSPWIFSAGSGKSYARVATNSKLPKGAKKTPDGNSFVLTYVHGQDSAGFAQNTRLEPQTSYNVSLLYSYIQFVGNRTAPFTDYGISVTYGYKKNFRSIFSIDVDQKRGDDNGKWISASGVFKTGNLPPATSENGNQGLFIDIASPGKASPSNSSTFGFDAISLTKVG